MKKIYFIHNNFPIAHQLQREGNESEYWYSFKANGQEFDVNIDKSDNKVYVYEYDKELDEPSHRYITVYFGSLN